MDTSRELRAEGLEIIEAFAFLDLLAGFGEVRLVGSVALDLVVKPDIDFHLVVDQSQVVEVTKAITGELIADERLSELRISDYLTMGSLKIGIDNLPGRSTDWSVDIWITSTISTTGFEELEKFKSLLNEENRKAILEIKRHYFEKGQLPDGLSPIIYRAVLKEGVKNLQDFQDYYERGPGGG